MTTNRILRLFDQHQGKERRVLPRAIAIDEFKGDAGGERFQRNVVDVENKEILQSFMYPFNNGYIEGMNNTIKVLKRDSFGIKNFPRLKNKILWQQEIKKVLV